MELFVGGVTGLIGYLAVSLTDRAIATRASATVKSPSAPIYSDWYRLGAAVGFTVVPLVTAHYIRSPLWRSGLQFFGVASLLYLGGKLADDLGAKMLHDNDTGKRLFGGEIAAQDLVAAAANTTPPAPGAGALPDQNVPPPPAFTGGQPSAAAMDAVRGHAPALKALGALAPDIAAMNGQRANKDQVDRVQAFQAKFASSMQALARFHPKELEAAVGLAGLAPMADMMKARPQGAPRGQGAPQQALPEETDSPYAWAQNN